ncbi:hypothetical protein [Winogradskyella vidalii]|uniref:hypothetical protein n=1 Tax=Winogradskyella vidalii TaxID=2615024 RepID=UPI0015CE17F3|nr:hypothetical protein [Winogradskyella vidalii]
MKNYLLVLILIVNLGAMSCGSDDPCEVNHVIINDECVPDYIFPEAEDLQNGDKYYHKKFGLIIYKDNQWTDERGSVIEDLEIKTD